MHRRQFVLGSSTAAAMGLMGTANAQSEPKGQREYYQLRRYHLQSGPQTQITENYFAHALIPALNKMGISPVGAFRLDFGPETPVYYLLMPSTSVEALATVDLQLAKDDEFVKAADAFWNAPASQPAFSRVESSLFAAFQGWPKLTPPPAKKRIFQLRTYESPSYKDHVVKVDMFHNGEFDIFARSGFKQVFYGDALVGDRLPCLTYMLSFADMAELDACWLKFRDDPAWQKLSHLPKYGSEAIVSNISNLILSPLSCSQI